jgi:hypothetical protein
MRKPLVGHHLMRVRIRKSIFHSMQLLAEEKTMQSGEHVTVSDIVRAACYNYLLVEESLRRLECLPPDMFDEDEDFEDTSSWSADHDYDEDEEDEDDEEKDYFDEDEHTVWIVANPMLRNN